MDTPSGSTSAPSSAAPSAPSTSAPSSTPAPSGGSQSATSAPTTPNSKFTSPPAGGTPSTTETAAERKARLLKLKVDGQEIDYDVDSTPDEKLMKDLQYSHAAQKRMQEAADLRKKFQDFVNNVKQDPFKVLKDPIFGIDLDKLAEQRLAQRYQEQLLSPQEQQVLQAQREAQQYKAQLEQIQKAQELQAQKELDARIEEETKRDFRLALEKSNLPPNDLTFGMMAQVASEALAEGLELTPQQMATEARERMSAMSQQVFSGLKGEQLLSYLGDSVVKEVLRTAVAKFQKPAVQPALIADPETKPAAKPKADPDGRKFWRTF